MVLIYPILGLLMITAQVRGIVILFGGHKKAPTRFKYCLAVGQILMLIALFGAME